MATLGPESARPLGTQLGSSPSIQSHIGGASLPPNRGLERALEEAVANGVLNLSSRKLKDFPRTASNHDLTDTVDAGIHYFSLPFIFLLFFRRCCSFGYSPVQFYFGGVEGGGPFRVETLISVIPITPLVEHRPPSVPNRVAAKLTASYRSGDGFCFFPLGGRRCT